MYHKFLQRFLHSYSYFCTTYFSTKDVPVWTSAIPNALYFYSPAGYFYSLTAPYIFQSRIFSATADLNWFVGHMLEDSRWRDEEAHSNLQIG